MDTKQVMARFEAERQALAMMDHPNIAHVFDAGATDSGRPYFVMELVRGIPITDYCDHNGLSPRERLELFVQVCRAVQHAHTKGIIHRDIKPTNVLVTLHEGVAVPKVIDFGVAKATGQQLTEKTLFTNFAQMVGTPLYMSPEQAEMTSVDVDTRSDVYSLGVLLYELLTGTTPLDKDRLKKSAFDEVRRIIREEDLPRPSMRLSTLGEQARIISARRKSDPKRLGALVRGELDWIVMKALEKDRRRRYETANGMARDIERYLHDDPVEACPPSTAYRLRKMMRRHRLAVVSALSLVAVLLVLVVGLTVTNRIVTKSRNDVAAALRQKDRAFKDAQAQRQRAEANFFKVRIAMQDLLLWPATGREGQLPESLQKKLVEVATRYYGSLGDESGTDPSLRYDAAVGQRTLGFLCNKTGDPKRSEELLKRSIATLESLHRDDPRRTEYRDQLAWSEYMLSETLHSVQRDAEALAGAERARDLYEALLAEHPTNPNYPGQVWWVYGSLVSKYSACGRMQEAAELCSRWVKAGPDSYITWYKATTFFLFIGEVERYRSGCREMLDRFAKRDEPEVAASTALVCALLPDSVPDFSRVERLERSFEGPEKQPPHGSWIMAKSSIGYRAGIAKSLIDYRAGRYRQVLDGLENQIHPDGDFMHATAFAIVAMAHQRLGHPDQARIALQSSRAIVARPLSDEGRRSTEWEHCQILLREAEQMLAK
jgi:eukaryotic-like serine/threonine-protein kinase